MSTDATEKLPASDPPAEAERRRKKAIRHEVLIVLGLSALTYTAYALVSLAYISLRTPARSAVSVTNFPHHFDPYGFANDLIGDITPLIPVALVLHLFRDSVRRLGLVFKRRDLVIGFAAGLLGLVAAIALVNAGRALGLPVHQIVPVNPDASASYIVLFFTTSVSAAIWEELIVNAYVLVRLDDLGWSANRALLLSALVRASYHVYQGVPSALAIGVGGLILGRIFQRTGRIVTPMVAHFTFDAIGFLGYFFLAPHVSWLRA
jgi:membrane protease YdiL (CAAX protease family)